MNIWSTIRRLALGIFLIVLAAGILLISDRDHHHVANRTKKWRIHLIQLVAAPAIDETREGIMAGLKEAGLVEGRDCEVHVGDAQGDMPTLSALVDAALTQQADMVYTITTPALQVAMQKVHDRPVLFALALDPLLVGDQGTHEKHRPNVAGVYDRSPFEGMMKILRECLPNAHVIGTLYAPSESTRSTSATSLIRRPAPPD